MVIDNKNICAGCGRRIEVRISHWRTACVGPAEEIRYFPTRVDWKCKCGLSNKKTRVMKRPIDPQEEAERLVQITRGVPISPEAWKCIGPRPSGVSVHP